MTAFWIDSAPVVLDQASLVQTDFSCTNLDLGDVRVCWDEESVLSVVE